MNPGFQYRYPEDRTNHHLYGQEHGGTAFYRYHALDDTWERLPTSPVPSGGGCGATLLDGTIYTSPGFDNTALGVYDIETQRWSTLPNPLFTPSANIASDGEQFLYLARGNDFVRYDPSSAQTVQLGSGPIFIGAATSSGFLDGKLYTNGGIGGRDFAVYDPLFE